MGYPQECGHGRSASGLVITGSIFNYPNLNSLHFSTSLFARGANETAILPPESTRSRFGVVPGR